MLERIKRLCATAPRAGSRVPRRGFAWLGIIGIAFALWGTAPSRGASAAAMPRTPKAYVALFGDNAVAVIDTASNKVIKTIPVAKGPEGLVASPDGTRIYATSAGASTVSVISTVTDRVVSRIEVGEMPHGLAITRDGRLVLVAVFGASRVAVIDTVRNQVVAEIPVGNPHSLAVSPDDRTVYVAAQQPGAAGLAIVDLATRQQVGMVPLDKTPRAVNFSPDGASVYFTQAGVNAVQVLDPKTNRIVTQIPTGASPHLPIFTANGEYELTVVQGPGQLAIINPATRTVIGSVPVGKFPHWAAPSADGDTAYVTNEGANSVTLVDVGKQQVLATFPVGAAPRKIVLQPLPSPKAERRPLKERRPIVASLASSDLAAQAPSAAAPTVGGTIRIENFAFAPSVIKVAPGTTVVWTNGDAIPHTSTSKDKAWDSHPIQPGATFKMTFDKVGTYAYACSIHPFMQATVTVAN